MDRLQRAAEILSRPRFHLNENERIAVSADQVDLATLPAPEMAVKDFETMTPEMACGQFFAAVAEAEVSRFKRQKPAAPPAQTSGDGSGRDRVHGVSGDAVRCRNLCAG